MEHSSQVAHQPDILNKGWDVCKNVGDLYLKWVWGSNNLIKVTDVQNLQIIKLQQPKKGSWSIHFISMGLTFLCEVELNWFNKYSAAIWRLLYGGF